MPGRFAEVVQGDLEEKFSAEAGQPDRPTGDGHSAGAGHIDAPLVNGIDDVSGLGVVASAGLFGLWPTVDASGFDDIVFVPCVLSELRRIELPGDVSGRSCGLRCLRL
jgi:hypothetical protein